MSTKVKLNPESRFIEAYKRENFDQNLFQQSIDNFIAQMNGFIIVQNDVIHHCKVFSVPDFLEINFDKDSQLLFNATMATGELLCNILLINDSELLKTTLKTNIDKANKYFNENIKKNKTYEHFYLIAEAALWILLIEKEATTNTEPPSYINDFFSTIEFMSNVLLIQRLLVHSRAFRAFVEVIGNFFINSWLIRNKIEKYTIEKNKSDKSTNDKNKTEKFNVISKFIENEKNAVNSSDNKTKRRDYQIYLNFVRTVIILYNDPQLPDMIRDTIIIKSATDFGVPEFFCSFVDLITSMIMTPELANYVFTYITRNASEILKFKNFFSAIFKHPDDLQNESDRQKLADKDTLGLQSVLRLLSAFFHQDLNKYLEDIGKEVGFKDNIDEFKDLLTKSLIKFILSPVPASLKAECFNCLSSMKVNLWHTLKTNILLYDESIKVNENEGIISDIFKVEVKDSHFSIPQALSNLIATMLEEKYSPKDFVVFHNFLYRVVLLNLNQWNYVNLDLKLDKQYMKWEMLESICKAWISLLKREDYLDLCDPLYQTAISENQFTEELIKLTNDENCPVECLIEVYRLFLLLAWKENEFLRRSLSTSRPLTAGIVSKISKDPVSVVKMLKCFTSHSMTLQIVSMELVEFIAYASPIIVQVLLSKQENKAIAICDCLIKNDESENIEDFQIDGFNSKNRNILDLLEKDEKGVPITLNARCFLLQILIKLGSSSYFVRHVCGFQQHDPPKSILSTNLDRGILNKIVSKLCEEETHINYPIFVAKSIQLILIECKNDLTINSTLNLLRSSLKPFFKTQLEFLSNPNSSRVAIGCFLQIMALENANSVQNGSSLSGIIHDSFNYLMIPLQNNQQIKNKWKRNVLFIDIIDRIDNDKESKKILDGINDLTVAYLSNPSIIELMNESKQTWPSSWMQIIFSLLEKVPNLTNSKLSQKVVGTCSLIANAVLADKKFDEVSPDSPDLKKLFASILEVISRLFDYNHYESRISAYSLISTTANSIICNDEIKAILQNKEKMILDSTLSDCRSEIPILRSLSFSVIESLLPFASPWAFLPFLEQSIAITDDDWCLFDSNPKAAAFCLSTKCRMYEKFLTSLKSDSSFSFTKISPDCKIIIDEALIVKLSNEKFWNGLARLITDSSKNEPQIQAATDILSLFSVISIAFNDSEDLRIQLNWFLKKFSNFFNYFIHFKNLTPCLLSLYASFFKLLSTLPNIEDIDSTDTFKINIPFIFMKFANEEDREGLLQNNSPEILYQSQEIISQLMMSGIFVLLKLSEKRDVFTDPLFGDEWRAQFSQEDNKLLPISIITSYLGKLIKDIKKNKTGKGKKSKKTNKKRGNDKDDANSKEKKRSVASACLLLIWYHINRWRHSAVSIDMGKVIEQAEAFRNEPYKSFPGNSSLDSLILKQLAQ